MQVGRRVVGVTNDAIAGGPLRGSGPFGGDSIAFDSAGAAGPVEVAPRIWWVGPVLADDLFQNHAYLVEAGEHSVLVDPGSTLTIDATLDKVRQVVPLDHVSHLLIHHSDPDVADALHRLDEVLDTDRVRMVTEWRSELLMRHFGARFRVDTIEDLGWRLVLDGDRVLEFVLTPYLHFPGAFVTYETSTATLLSADLFGGFNRGRRLWATSTSDFEDLRQFHEHYMPSREILMTGLASIRAAAPRIRTLCPQHGYVISADLIDPLFDELNGLDCGVFSQSKRDAHLRRLLEAATAVRHVEEALQESTDPTRMSEVAEAALRSMLPVAHVWIEVATSPGPTPTGADSIRFRVGDPALGEHHGPFTVSDDRHVVVPVVLDDGRSGAAVVELTEETSIPAELASMLSALAPAVRVTAAHLLAELEVASHHRRLSDQAYRDPLTGVQNRRAFDEWSTQAPPSGVLMLDIDHFKQVNDTFGHPVGDEVLRQVARAIATNLRADERVYRYGGEEFVVVVTTVHDDELAAVAERLRSVVADLVFADDLLGGRGVTVSVGAHQLGPDETPADGVRQADLGLYEAKRAGRDRVIVI